MADKSELRMNLAAIKRVDPYAKDILDSSAHVAFYTFNPDESEWEKTDVEGAFFVYSRNAEPYNSVFINNRLNTNSLVEPLTAGIELQNQTPFLLYRNERSRIRGFWFYNKTECDRLSEIINRLVNDAEPITESQKSGDSTNVIGQQPFDFMPYANSNVDIFSMLTKAQQDFNNALIAPNVKAAAAEQLAKKPANDASDKRKALPQSQKPAPAKSYPQHIPLTNNGTPQSVMNFFAAAKPTTPGTQRTLTQPIHIDQIEKRVKTPLKEKPASPKQTQSMSYAQPANAQTAQSVENGLKLLRMSSPTQAIDLGTSPLATFIASNNLSAIKAPAIAKSVESSQQLKDSLQLLKKPVPVNKAATAIPLNTTPNKPALMPPTMFESTASDSKTPNQKITKPEANESNKKPAVVKGREPTKSRKKLIHEYQAQSKDDLSMAVQPLTETQLLQAISYLMKNDPDFIKKIHEAYLKSFAEMVSQ